jgi:hypothetical protein
LKFSLLVLKNTARTNIEQIILACKVINVQ